MSSITPEFFKHHKNVLHVLDNYDLPPTLLQSLIDISAAVGNYESVLHLATTHNLHVRSQNIGDNWQKYVNHIIIDDLDSRIITEMLKYKNLLSQEQRTDLNNVAIQYYFSHGLFKDDIDWSPLSLQEYDYDPVKLLINGDYTDVSNYISSQTLESLIRLSCMEVLESLVESSDLDIWASPDMLIELNCYPGIIDQVDLHLDHRYSLTRELEPDLHPTIVHLLGLETDMDTIIEDLIHGRRVAETGDNDLDAVLMTASGQHYECELNDPARLCRSLRYHPENEVTTRLSGLVLMSLQDSISVADLTPYIAKNVQDVEVVMEDDIDREIDPYVASLFTHLYDAVLERYIEQGALIPYLILIELIG